MNQDVHKFFSRFDEANRSSDFAVFGELYADRFMFARSDGANVVEREGFIKVLPDMKTILRSRGLLDSRVQAVEAHTLDSNYLLAKVEWRISVASSSGTKYDDISATYILARGISGSLEIVFQLDHQDLSARIKTLQESQ